MELEQLETGPIYSFRDWPNRSVPRLPGVYSGDGDGGGGGGGGGDEGGGLDGGSGNPQQQD